MPGFVPRELFFGNPEVHQILLSPDGQWISYIAPEEGVLNVWLAPFERLETAKTITRDRNRGIHYHGWTPDSRYLFYIQDEGGEEDWHIHAVSIPGGEYRDLTPYPKTQAKIHAFSPGHPDKMLVSMNRRDPRYHDAYILDMTSGKLTETFHNEGFFDCFTVDFDLKLRFLSKFNPDGSESYVEVQPSGRVKKFMDVPQEDTAASGLVGLNKSGDILYIKDSQGRDTAALYRYSLKDGSREIMAEDARSDVHRVLQNPLTWEVEATCFYYERQDWRVHAPECREDFELFKKSFQGDFEITSRSLDCRKWILEELRDDGPSRFHLYERSQKNLRHLMDQRKELAGKALPSSRPVEIISRDGLKLVSYLILPAKEKGAVPAKPLPMVLDAHEGPWRRNFKAFHPFRQLLADRGYAVLAVNYRGSTGFGKKFVAAGNLEWGRKMNEDLADAVQWAVKEKIADPARVAVLGFSYGGYATLAALAFTPDLFACGIDMSGPCDLNSLLENAPDYWAATWMQIYHSRMGDPSTPEGKKLLQDRSPALHVDGIKKPLLIAQGANDPKVMRSDTDKFVKALKEKGVPVTYALYPDEGQGFHRPENNLAFMALAEAFLKKHLGGEAEPIGKSFEGSSLRILEGKEGIPGL